MASSDKDEGVSYVHQDTGTGVQTAAGQGQYATDKYDIRVYLTTLTTRLLLMISIDMASPLWSWTQRRRPNFDGRLT